MFSRKRYSYVVALAFLFVAPSFSYSGDLTNILSAANINTLSALKAPVVKSAPPTPLRTLASLVPITPIDCYTQAGQFVVKPPLNAVYYRVTVIGGGGGGGGAGGYGRGGTGETSSFKATTATGGGGGAGGHYSTGFIRPVKTGLYKGIDGFLNTGILRPASALTISVRTQYWNYRPASNSNGRLGSFNSSSGAGGTSFYYIGLLPTEIMTASPADQIQNRMITSACGYGEGSAGHGEEYIFYRKVYGNTGGMGFGGGGGGGARSSPSNRSGSFRDYPTGGGGDSGNYTIAGSWLNSTHDNSTVFSGIVGATAVAGPPPAAAAGQITPSIYMVVGDGGRGTVSLGPSINSYVAGVGLVTKREDANGGKGGVGAVMIQWFK